MTIQTCTLTMHGGSLQVCTAIEEQTWTHQPGVFYLLIQRCWKIVGISEDISGLPGEEGEPPECSSCSGF